MEIEYSSQESFTLPAGADVVKKSHRIRVEEIENGDCQALIEAIMAKPLEELKELYNTREIEK